jgi:hypothetical protein
MTFAVVSSYRPLTLHPFVHRFMLADVVTACAPQDRLIKSACYYKLRIVLTSVRARPELQARKTLDA